MKSDNQDAYSLSPMVLFRPACALLTLGLGIGAAVQAQGASPSPYGDPAAVVSPYPAGEIPCSGASIDSIKMAELEQLKWSIPRDSLIREVWRNQPSPLATPRVFRGLQPLRRPHFTVPEYRFRMRRSRGYDADRYAGILYAEPILEEDLEEGDELLSISPADTVVASRPRPYIEWDDVPQPILQDESEQGAGTCMEEEPLPDPTQFVAPAWIRARRDAQAISDEMAYVMMMTDPTDIGYLYWQLPVAPQVKDDPREYSRYLMHHAMPIVNVADAVLPKSEQRRVYWLHTVGSALQFSQAYISDNWYQGGNDYLALLFNFNWDVALNTVYKPNLMFTSSLSYKLAVNSNSKEALHHYSISQDALQYNLKAGLKAFRKWFYSFNLQFKTQIFNTYPADSPDMTAAFLSPADLNMGLGMTYNTEALSNRLKLSVSVSPISYNLKTCINHRIDPALFNIEPGRKTRSEIGSNAEATLSWDITSNISWKSRMFLFTDYHYFQADWENTFTFNITRFLSTQFYIHPRYDSSTIFGASDWHYWQLKEILSFGLSYTFSTKP